MKREEKQFMKWNEKKRNSLQLKPTILNIIYHY